jgi:hypothetical protein
MSNTRKTWKLVVAGLIAISFAAAIGGWNLLQSTVTITNEAPIALTDVRITLAGKEIWTGDLGSGEKKQVHGKPDTDGTLGISFKVDARNFHQEFTYVSPGPGEHHSLLVLPSLEVRYLSEP